MSGTPVLVPVNLLERAKGRLSTLLTPAQRRQLATITLRTVVEAATGAGGRVVILTADPAVAALKLNAEIVDESPEAQGLNGQLSRWVADNASLPELLILHADLPLASKAAIEGLLRVVMPSPGAVAVKSPDGGTNAMLLRPPAGFPLSYGPGSFGLHRHGAIAARFAFREHLSPALRIDLDTPGDVDTLLSTSSGRASAAGRYLMDVANEANARRR